MHTFSLVTINVNVPLNSAFKAKGHDTRSSINLNHVIIRQLTARAERHECVVIATSCFVTVN